MDLGLKGKVALITGGSKGIGLETAVQIAKEGGKVAICARGQEGLEQAAAIIKVKTGTEALTIQADVTKEEDCQRAVQQTVDLFGALHILVNNAGTHAAAPFEKVETEMWRQNLI